MERKDIVLPDGTLRKECRDALRAMSGPLGRMWVALFDYKRENGYEMTDEEMSFAEKVLSSMSSEPPSRDLRRMMEPFFAKVATCGWTLDDEKTEWRFQTDLLMSKSSIVLRHRRHTGAAVFVREMRHVPPGDPSLGISITIMTTHKGGWTSEKPDGTAVPIRQSLADAAAWLCGE